MEQQGRHAYVCTSPVQVGTAAVLVSGPDLRQVLRAGSEGARESLGGKGIAASQAVRSTAESGFCPACCRHAGQQISAELQPGRSPVPHLAPARSCASLEPAPCPCARVLLAVAHRMDRARLAANPVIKVFQLDKGDCNEEVPAGHA